MSQLPERTEKHGDETARWVTEDLRDQFLVSTTLPHETPQCRALILCLIDCEARRTDQLVGEEFFVGEYIVHPVPLMNDDGEEYMGRRIVFPQPEGMPVSSTSKGVLDAMLKLSHATGLKPPWDPPLRVKLRQSPTRNGRRRFWLELIIRD